MSAIPFKNIYHARHVAESSQKPCTICYKPTSVVLVSEDGKNDFFYTCQAHLLDKGFAVAVADAAGDAARKRQVELVAEIEKVKKDWEKRSKQKKSEREAEKKKRKEDDKGEKSESEYEAQKTLDKRDKAEHKEQLSKLEQQMQEAKETAEKPARIYTLNKDMFMIRVNNWKNIQRAKRTAELLRKPGGLPSVPKGDPKEDES
ncbi:VPS4-associated protein 1 [Lipomyces oligophaga]|uniref:VPS4-associated protein 1 n=1 Tax=Lipomyces oligophaga TaxID=45792 RepID=UPI0034CFAB50